MISEGSCDTEDYD